jgi:hypothetical protein
MPTLFHFVGGTAPTRVPAQPLVHPRATRACLLLHTTTSNNCTLRLRRPPRANTSNQHLIRPIVCCTRAPRITTQFAFTVRFARVVVPTSDSTPSSAAREHLESPRGSLSPSASHGSSYQHLIRLHRLLHASTSNHLAVRFHRPLRTGSSNQHLIRLHRLLHASTSNHLAVRFHRPLRMGSSNQHLIRLHRLLHASTSNHLAVRFPHSLRTPTSKIRRFRYPSLLRSPHFPRLPRPARRTNFQDDRARTCHNFRVELQRTNQFPTLRPSSFDTVRISRGSYIHPKP